MVESTKPHGSIAVIGLGLLVSRLAQPVMSFALFALVTRFLPLAEMGIYVLLMGLLFIFQAGATLGLGPLITREVTLDIHAIGSWLGAAVAVLIPAALLNWLLFPLCIRAMGYHGPALLGGVILGGSLPFYAGIQVGEAVFLACGRGSAIAIENVVENAFRLAVSLVFLLQGYGLPALLLVHVASRALGFCLSMWLLRPLLSKLCLTFDWRRSQVLLAGVFTFGLMSVAAMVCFRLDVILLSLLRSETEVGLYGAAYRLLALAFLLPESLVGAMFPILSRQLSGQRQAARDLVAVGVQLILTIELPLCLAVAALAGRLVPLLFGAPFQEASLLLVVLIFTLLPHSLNGLLGFVLQADHQERRALRLVLAALVINLVLDICLIRILGMMGAAWGTLFSFTLVSGLHLWVVNRQVFHLNLLRPLMQLLTSGVAGLAVFCWPPARGCALSLVAPLVCCLTLALLGGLSRTWLERTWALIGRGR